MEWKMIVLKNVSKNYGDKENKVQALKNVNLVIEEK